MTTEATLDRETTFPEAKVLIAATRPFQKEQRWRSWWHLASGIGLLVGSVGVAMVGPGWPLRAAGVALAALAMLKVFVVYHDFMHRAILRRSRVAKLVMHAFGYFILAPPAIWKRSHDFHHAHTAKLAGSQVGSFPTLSTLMYERLPPGRRLAYRLARSPLVIVFGLVTIFLVGMCLSPLVKKPRENRDAAWALLIYAGLGVIVTWSSSLEAFLVGIVAPHAVAAALGSYLFYAQHNFPGVEIRARHGWQYAHAALRASSHCRMGVVMRWFSGNIGYHHVHHLNSAIPFYNLPAAMERVPELRDPIETSLRPGDVVACLRLKLWDPKAGCMVGFSRRSWKQRWAEARAGSKPNDVEEPIDSHWHRPLAGMIARALEPTAITPNQVTVASGLLGFSSGLALALASRGDTILAALGGLLLLAAAILDCADGQLARLKGMTSPLGRALDGLMDAVGPTAVLTAMAVFLVARGHSPALVFAAGAVTGASLLWHAHQYDVAKNVYLHCTEPDFELGGDALVTPAAMAAMRDELRAARRPFAALVMLIWEGWTRAQMRQIVPWLSPDQTPRRPAERALYRALVGPIMRLTTWLGFGFHVTVLAASMLLTPVLPDAIWLGWLVIVLPLNALAVFTAVMRTRRERLFAEELAARRASGALG